MVALVVNGVDNQLGSIEPSHTLPRRMITERVPMFNDNFAKTPSCNARTSIFPTTRLRRLWRLNEPRGKAWHEFFSVYGPVIYRMARHARLSEEAAEELVAIVMRNFVGTVVNGFTYDPAQGRFRQYLRTITNRS